MKTNNYKRGTGRKTYVIVVDGETEIWYLHMLRRNEDLRNISIKPELPRKKSLADQFRMVEENANIYDKCIWILDLDVILANEMIPEFRSYLDVLNAVENVHVLINTPCLEFWFLQHVKDTGAFHALCDSVGTELKKHAIFEEYAKSEKYFANPRSDIYRRLRPNLIQAIANASRRGNFDIDNPLQGKAEMYKLFDILGIEIAPID